MTGPQMNLEPFWEECPGAVWALRKRFLVPFLVCIFIMLRHQLHLLGMCQLSIFQSFDSLSIYISISTRSAKLKNYNLPDRTLREAQDRVYASLWEVFSAQYPTSSCRI